MTFYLFRTGNDRFGHGFQGFPVLHAVLLQPAVGFVFRYMIEVHEAALGPVDGFARLDAFVHVIELLCHFALVAELGNGDFDGGVPEGTVVTIRFPLPERGE